MVRGLFGPNTTLVLGLMSASALLYSLNTWLPELMRRNGFGQTASLAFLIFSNGGGVFRTPDMEPVPGR